MTPSPFPALHPLAAAAAFAAMAAMAPAASAHGDVHAEAKAAGLVAVPAPAGRSVPAPYDLLHARITTEGHVAVFHLHVAGTAGSVKPAATGQLGGAGVHAYVWPTTLDPSVVGFAPRAGVLALAVTSHPDFDDTPLFPAPAGAWHSHWVVLQPDDTCGPGALKVVDIPSGTKPPLPKTWPGLPILIDSPGWVPRFDGPALEVRVPFDDIGVVKAASFDAVTAGLRVNASVHSPLLCVVDVFDVASGNLSLPGRVDR